MPQRLMLYVLFSIFIGCNMVKAADESTDSDWLFKRHIDLSDYLATDRSIGESERKQYTIDLYWFAFEYWLISRTNQTAAPFHWRGRFRDLFHRLNNAERFSDPAAMAPFILTNGGVAPLATTAGEYVIAFPRANLPGIDSDKLTIAQYQELVRRFDLAFADFQSVFPPNPAPTNSSPFISPKV